MYEITEEKVVIESEEYITYGIKCNIACINNVSVNKTDVERLVDRCNRYELDPIHLYDIVEDFLENNEKIKIEKTSEG